MRAIRYILLIAIAAGLTYGGVVAWNSDRLKLERVEVGGIQRATAEDVVEASGLNLQDHLLRISTSEVARKIADEIAWVDRAEVERILPSIVRITVFERTPVAVVVYEGRPFVVDLDGVLLEEKTEPLLSILDLPPESLELGGRIAAPSFRHSMEIIAELPPKVGELLRSISASKVDRITLHLEGDIDVLYGANELLDEKNFALMELLSRVPDEGFTHIDVRVPSRPATR